ncbi:uncharacterized protein LOC116351317 [Contarinia nasturtii]|uniref:uncharacterized protein LOC116351317 n=1 Tax=Contarinia nasturtii TaxID=265458 RepID=UPI0012D40B7D|nr:uncharacterized protein LOC116351317 [Contarinia nasturtii]
MSKVIVSNKGIKKSIFFEGYKYRYDKTYNGTEYYMCDTSRSHGCRARLHKPVEVDDQRHYILKGRHLHSGDSRKLHKKEVMTKLKILSKTTHMSKRQVIIASIQGITNATRSTLPSERTMSRMVTNYRRDPQAPKNPRNFAELVLPPNYRITLKGDPFLLYDSFDELDAGELQLVADRTLIFTTLGNLNFLTECDGLFMDGTFSVVPVLFGQLYSIHGLKRGWHLPSVFILMSNKKEETYNEIFEFMLRLAPINPTDFMVDFEMAAMNSVTRYFPLADLHGCHFHFGQSVWRKIQEVGLQKQYNEDEEFALNLRMLVALAFVPVDDVIKAYEELVETAFFNSDDPKIDELLDYFQSTYIYRIDRKGKKQSPRFAIPVWNVYENTLAGFPRTNNNVEGWHNKINSMWGKHPNLFTFIEKLKEEQEITELAIAQCEAGNDPDRRRKKYEMADKKLIRLIDKFDKTIHDGSYIPYLKEIAHNARF